MKKIPLYYAAIFTLVLSGCFNLFLEKPQDYSGGNTDLPETSQGFGTIQVSFSRGAARTIMPEVDLAGLYLQYWFTKDGGPAEEKTPAGGVFTLEPGTYSLEVKAFIDGGRTIMAASGTTDTDFTIAAGLDAGTVNVALRPVVTGEGTGSLSFSLEYPAGVTVETFTLTRIAGAENPVDLVAAGTVSGANPLTLSGAKTALPVGYYLLRTVLKNSGGTSTGRTEVVHIYQNLSAAVEYTFIADDFRGFRVTAAADSGPGSLRQALTSALSMTGGLIQVLLEPGSVIELESALPELVKNITLEGNGVTLTRAASWTGSDSYSQLFRISGSTTAVKISGVHFKNGRTMYNGGAVYSSGILTLESCIFSGNATAAATAYGGAVYSANTLTVRGCTFYGNSSGYYGGALYFDASGKTLTLTGNLFSGNTATTGYPVVCLDNGTINASYNVVDLNFGTGSGQAGWAVGTGNRYSSVLPVSGKTFKVLYNSPAAAKLPAALPADYPAADFYGQAINGNGAAGAVQALTANGYSWLDLSVNNSLGGSVSASPEPDEDGLYPNGSSITITAALNPGYSLNSWLQDGAGAGNTNPLNITLTAHSSVQAVFSPRITVTDFTDGMHSGTLRYALTYAQDNDVIRLSGVTAGITVIELTGPLPEITKNITIEGNGVTLTRSASWTGVSETSQLLRITNTGAEVRISGVHFKNGQGSHYGGAIDNRGILTLESCIFSGNVAITDISAGVGGAAYSTNTLTVRGCTFYNNSANSGGALFFSASGKILTLTGNLFYGNTGNTATYFPVVRINGGTVSASYNVVDAPFGTNPTSTLTTDQCGWDAGTGDVYYTSGLPIWPGSFKLLYGSPAAAKLPGTPPTGYPTTDFYGQAINGGGAAGAVQALAPDGYSWLDLSANDGQRGSLSATSAPDAGGLYPNDSTITITATPNPGCSLEYWLQDGVKAGTENPLNITLTTHTAVQAVFSRTITVNDFTDGAGSVFTPGTLRCALTNAQDLDVIRFSGVTAGATAIELTGPLPEITKNITIEGNGVTLTRSASWTGVSNTSQLLRIGSTEEVKISGVHFKNGKASYGGAIYNTGTLTLESCIFSGNSATSGSGGAVHSYNSLTLTTIIRGCTFYNNSASSSGGAVNFGAHNFGKTLTGNLFYGNTAVSYPVVYQRYGTFSASYNVVDTAFGTDTTQCGWEQGTGDEYYSSGLPVSPLSFRLLYGGGAANKLPAVLPADYPTTDFYGQAINGGGAAGAVQTFTANGSGYSWLDLSVNYRQMGSLSANPAPDDDGLVPNDYVAITATPNPGHFLDHWIKDGVDAGNANPLPITLTTHSSVQAVFGGAVAVTDFTDGMGSGTLRYVLTYAQDGAVISLSGVTPGTTVIELTGPLPAITKNITIEGNGVTLTRAASWIDDYKSYSQLLRITGSTAEVKISGVHFKNSLMEVVDAGSGVIEIYNGGAVYNTGILTLESCVFSGNQAYDGGAVNSTNTLTVRGCTFYNNSANSRGGAVYFDASGKTLTLTGNLFYGNTAGGYPVAYNYNNSGTVNASYNVADVALGTSFDQCGWAAGTGDTQITGLPVSPVSFKLLYGSGAANKLPAPLPADYPTTDFYGQPIKGGGAAGAVQAFTANGSGYSWLDLSVNDRLGGSLSTSPAPDADGLYPNGSPVTITAAINPGYSLEWLKDGAGAGTANPLTITLTTHTTVQAVFSPALTVTDFSDGAGSDATTGTLRYALLNAQDGDVISVNGTTPGLTAIELTGPLPEITKNITIVGNGVILTRAASWTASDSYSQLLRIIGDTAVEVKISGVHFKNGLATGSGVAIYNRGILTLESCIFSGNRTTGSGGAVYSNANHLTIRGCTFYNNSAGYSGGAVYFYPYNSSQSYSLILTGNLFYGNTAGNRYPVVDGYGGFNTSYNVVDVTFGINSDRCGWNTGTGDTQITGLPVSPVSFKLLYGSGAANKLPATLPADYPVTDFYGQPISGGGAAGAVQAFTTNQSGYSWLGLPVNYSQMGSVSASPVPDADGLVPNGSLTITATPNPGHSLDHWLKDGVEAGAANPLSINLTTHTVVQAVFAWTATVNDFTDGMGSRTLRYALTYARESDVISLSGVTPGTTVIELTGPLPEITKNITIVGNGVTLTRAASWTTSDYNTQLLRISGSTAEVKISGVHFKDGLASYNGGAITNSGILTLESCIFSGSRTTNSTTGGGAIFSNNALTIRGCTFYNNNSVRHGGAVYFDASGKTLTLTGNIFYGNTAASGYPVVRNNSGSISASYNVVDVALGTGSAQSGWNAGTGDKTFTALGISGDPFNTTSFVLVVSALQNVLPAAAQANFPLTDFYGAARTFPGAPGAVVTPLPILDITYSDVSGGTWTLESDGRRKSPVTAHNGVTKSRVSFTSTAADQVITIQLDVSSESGYDWAFISALDNADAAYNSGYYARISGTTSQTVSIPVPAAGSHFVDIGYRKDNAYSSGSDCAWFKVLE